ncbi:hypothetical protein [Streptomyces sedi]|uniref:Uncharacterized protein n=1 Tax=Streptomyces sedi TaxID=555059 RepID=A0A5C4VC85_9ACTN|nr:hypothetical protein [Streptomyces sedi]TNM33490.1 hypothetical protein FH715_03810 [Streptomyces sedi]
MTRVRAIEWDGTVWDDPSPERLGDLLADMNHRFRFLIVEWADAPDPEQWYLQVRLEDDGSHTVEYREGGPFAHYTARVERRPEPWGLDFLVSVVNDWAAGGSDWRTALPWRLLSPEELV